MDRYEYRLVASKVCRCRGEKDRCCSAGGGAISWMRRRIMWRIPLLLHPCSLSLSKGISTSTSNACTMSSTCQSQWFNYPCKVSTYSSLSPIAHVASSCSLETILKLLPRIHSHNKTRTRHALQLVRDVVVCRPQNIVDDAFARFSRCTPQHHILVLTSRLEAG